MPNWGRNYGIHFVPYTSIKIQEIMSLQEILDHRRAVRHYDANKPIDKEVVRNCIEQATLAPTSVNMQLWEAYDGTDKNVLKE